MPRSKMWKRFIDILPVASLVFGGITACGVGFTAGYQIGRNQGETAERQTASIQMTEFKDKISDLESRLSSAYILRSMAIGMSIQSIPQHTDINVAKEILVSVEEDENAPLVVIRRADDRVVLAKHKLFYLKPFTLRYWTGADDGSPSYLFTYFKSGKEDQLTITKLVRAQKN